MIGADCAEFARRFGIAIEDALPAAVADIEVRMINGAAGDTLDYADQKGPGLKVIAIGGDKLARGLTLGERQLDDGEFLDVFTATPEELLAWCRDGQVTDAKTLSCVVWVQNVLSGAWPLNW